MEKICAPLKLISCLISLFEKFDKFNFFHTSFVQVPRER